MVNLHILYSWSFFLYFRTNCIYTRKFISLTNFFSSLFLVAIFLLLFCMYTTLNNNIKYSNLLFILGDCTYIVGKQIATNFLVVLNMDSQHTKYKLYIIIGEHIEHNGKIIIQGLWRYLRWFKFKNNDIIYQLCSFVNICK